MGYSYAAKAGYTLDAITALVTEYRPDLKASNSTLDGGFWETGREQKDGAITGTVWRPTGIAGFVCRGSFRIDPNGAIVRFPAMTTEFKRKAEAAGAARYAANYGTWRERAKAMLADLETDKIIGKLSWSWFESIFAGWQSEMRIMFAIQPNANNADMAHALRGMLAD
jgi:hypothetical protein